MKKLVSVLLALALVLSMGTIAFAEDVVTTTDATAETTTEATTEATTALDGVEIAEIIDMFKNIFANVDLKEIANVFKETVATLGNIKDIVAGLLENSGLAELEITDQIASLVSEFINGVAKLFGTDRESIIDALMKIPFVKEIMSWYGYTPATTAAATTAPATEIPETGAAAGIAVFATLSVAAAAAFVSKKKAA